MQYDKQITISIGTSRKEMNWVPQTLRISELWKRLEIPMRGKESLAAYLALNKSGQDDLKDIGGFVGGDLSGRRRRGNLRGRDVITLDLDNIPPEGTQEVLRRVEHLGCCYAVYSTRKHSPAAPRLRVLAVTDQTMTPEEYEPIARRLAQLIQPEMTWFDPTTFQAERLMYWPSCCADGQYIYRTGDKPFLSVSGVLRMYSDWHNVTAWPQVPGEIKLRDCKISKQGDPTEKQGAVGAFCRTYDVPAAMAKFLPGVYAETDTPGRYTYTGGSTAGGAVLYDDGKFLYSHHATDPCSGILVNAFDLVRLHKFAEQDEEAKEGTPVNRMPSYSAMMELVSADPGAGALLRRENGERALADFGDIEAPNRLPAGRYTDLTTFVGEIEKKDMSMRMVADALDVLGVSFRFEVVSRELELPGIERFGWSRENAANNLPVYLRDLFRSANVKGASTAAIQECLSVIADERRYNAVWDMLENHAWDGLDRLEILYDIMRLSPADKLSRNLVKKWLLQCIALALNDDAEPYGADGVLTLLGAQGIGKTSLARTLAISTKLFVEGAQLDFRTKDTVIRATSAWITELGEMESTLRKADEQLKAFITDSVDNYRMPYARVATKKPRRTSFIGTVNNCEYLRDPTGGRRYWTVPLDSIDLPRLFSLSKDWFKQLWVQMYGIWRAAGVHSFRLTPAEREQLAARNQEHAEPLKGEQEVLDLLDFELPVEEWRWVSPAVLASFSGKTVDSRGVGRILMKLMKADDRIQRQQPKNRKLYKIPLSQAYVIS